MLNDRMRTLRRRLKKVALFALNATWAIPAVVLIRIVRPLVHVRMGTLESSRIGHFIADASLFLARRSLQSRKEQTIDLFWFPKQTCNEQWARMVRRRLFVRWWVMYLVRFNRLIPGGAAHNLPQATESLSRDIYSIFQQSPARFTFKLEEEEAARAWLRRRGWRDGEPFICLLVRDSAYLLSHPLHADGGIERWNYHNYRDSDIDTYVQASQALVDKGYWVIRMGKVMRKRFSFQHPRVIDYPFVADQDDLLDIWLSVNCRFFVATASGIDTIPWVYGKPPVAYVNALPLSLCASPINNIWVPKHLRWKNNGRPLTLREHCEHGYGVTAEYEQAGIAIEDLSPAEITVAAMECEQRIAGTWVDTKEDQDRQRRFWETLRKWPDFPKFHGSIHPEARVGRAWLKSMGDVFFE